MRETSFACYLVRTAFWNMFQGPRARYAKPVQRIGEGVSEAVGHQGVGQQRPCHSGSLRHLQVAGRCVTQQPCGKDDNKSYHSLDRLNSQIIAGNLTTQKEPIASARLPHHNNLTSTPVPIPIHWTDLLGRFILSGLASSAHSSGS